MHTLEDSVYRVATQWFFATAQRDTVAAARILDDRFMAQDPNGVIVTKPALLHEMSAGRYHSLTGDIHDIHVQRVGDVAVVLTRMGWGRAAGTDTGALFRASEMFVRDAAGRWRLASEQSARILPVHVTVQDSIGAANAVHQLLQVVEQDSRAMGTWSPGAAPSVFTATEPHRLDDMEVLDRTLSFVDVPRWVYFDTTAIPVVRLFDPERLRLQMLSPDAAIATFEVARPDTIDRRTIVLQRDHGEWKLVHVHASSVAALPDPAKRRSVCRTVPPPPMLYPPQPPRVAKIPAPQHVPHSVTDASIVVGVVTDATNGLPVGEAEVVLDVFDPAPRVRVPGQTVRTDTLGGFHIEGVGPGRYQLRVREYAHAPVTDTVNVRGGEVDTASVRLPYYRCTGY